MGFYRFSFFLMEANAFGFQRSAQVILAFASFLALQLAGQQLLLGFRHCADRWQQTGRTEREGSA